MATENLSKVIAELELDVSNHFPFVESSKFADDLQIVRAILSQISLM